MATYREPSSWKPPSQGTTKREEMPRSAFLDSAKRRYPYKIYRNGKWVASEKGALAAYDRAMQQHEYGIARRALRILNKIRKEKGKEPLEWKR